MVGGYKNGWWLWSSQEQLNQLEKKPERESIDPRHSRVGQHRTGKMYFLSSGDSIDYFDPCLPRVVFQKLLF